MATVANFITNTGRADLRTENPEMETLEAQELGIHPDRLSPEERGELVKLGILSEDGSIHPSPFDPKADTILKKAIHASDVLNEAYRYHPQTVSFSRGMRLELGPFTLLLISGTASVDEHGQSAHVGDIRAQCWRTYRNITRLLEAEGANWHDVVRCTCYLRDIERDYQQFNAVRTAFFRWLGLNPLPASTGIQARLCRSDLLVEIEAIALIPSSRRE